MFRLCNSIMVTALLTVSSASMAAVLNDESKDSVSSWGPWDGVNTAAGPTVTRVPFRVGFADSQNMTNATAFETSIEQEQASGWKGYVAFNNREKGTIALDLNPDQQRVIARVESESGESILFDQNGRFYQPGEIVRGWGGVADAGYKYRQFTVDSDSLGLSTSPVTHWRYGKIVDSDDVTFGILDSVDQHVFVAGNVASISDIQKLNLGNVTASYSGYGWYYGSPGYAANNITVNFGDKSWSGSWQGGVDVQASGVLQGQGFASTSIVGEGVTAGKVDGTFYGANAHSLGGQLDITKNGNRVVGVFINEQVQP